MKSLPHLLRKLWPRLVFSEVGQTSRSRSLGHKFWYQLKGLVTRYVHMKYESATSFALEAMVKVKVF